MHPIYFSNPEEFRQWLQKHGKVETELWVGFYKRATKIPSMTWSESVDQALCFGWIDGIRKRIDAQKYVIRFTPRNPKSHWSAVNLKKIESLKRSGQMQPEGLKVYQQRDKKNTGGASYEQRNVHLDPTYIKAIQSNPKAWDYWEKLAPSYKKATTWWVMSAKKEETQLRRLQILIESCRQQLKVPPLRNS